MVVLEAMSLGNPSSRPTWAVFPEAVVNEETGLLVPVGDDEAFDAALLRLASNPGLAERLGRAGASATAASSHGTDDRGVRGSVRRSARAQRSSVAATA